MAKTFSLVFTGLSGSGKTTLAKRVTDELIKKGVHVQLIDGDDFRNELGNLFGYTREERMKHNRVVRTVMRYLNRNDVNVIFALVAPYEEMRQGMREDVGQAYVEAYTKCTSETCARRDVKGHYKKHREGTMQNLNGVDDVFEEPGHSEIVVDTEHDSEEACVGTILRYLREHGYIEYKYITENNLENRQDYMYSAYHGEIFLDAYRKTRGAFMEGVGHTSRKISFSESGTQNKNETNGRLVALAKKLESGRWTDEEQKETDYFVKAFEIRKRLYNTYQAASLRPVEESGYDCVDNYILLSFCAYHSYLQTQSLKYLNAMLKVDDTLLSLVARLSQQEKEKLNWLLQREIDLVRQEERRAG